MVRLDGKFFREGEKKFFVKGVTYGPFAPNASGEFFPSAEQAAKDFRVVRELGANLLRVYYVPPPWLLDLASENELKVLIDIPWPKHLCFLDSREYQQQARDAVRDAVQRCKHHPAVFAYSVVNEIPADVVRWSGPKPVEDFIDELIAIAKSVDPQALCTFTSFPPTEFLAPRLPDFLTFNVYLHEPKALANYLTRLQTRANDKPLLLGEFGIDSIREGEDHKSDILASSIETAFRAGLVGTIVFSFTDDWFRGGFQIEDWAFGLTTRARKPKSSFFAVQKSYRVAPYFPLPSTPRVSVVVASYNGARTLRACLDSLLALNYPNYEVILVDDGSTDNTPEIAKLYPQAKYLQQANQGLSVARNTGVRAATGEIVAFTDADCRADPDWLYYLVSDLLKLGPSYVGIGGHNFLPPDDSPVAAAVLASPGGPAHVMITDLEAEHIPGCNMAFYKWALHDINGFDPVYRKAGDDVDVCWRLQERGHKLGFSPAGFVWHYRRSTINAYLRQQAGYGEAEALLIQKHPERFNSFGGSLWKGRIYGTGQAGVIVQEPIIYHGVFASGFFQTMYTAEPAVPLMLGTSLAFHLIATVPLLLLSVYFPNLLPLAVAAPVFSVTLCVWAAAQAHLPPSKSRFWSRPLIAWLFFLQPLVRGWARIKYRFLVRPAPKATAAKLELPAQHGELPETLSFWTQTGGDRFAFLQEVLRISEALWPAKPDSGWEKHDAEFLGSFWARLHLTTVTEELGEQKRVYRCRLDTRWSWPSRIALAVAIIAVAAIIYGFASVTPWIWMALVAVPLLSWVFEDERDYLTEQTAAVLKQAATTCNWLPLDDLNRPADDRTAGPLQEHR